MNTLIEIALKGFIKRDCTFSAKLSEFESSLVSIICVKKKEMYSKLENTQCNSFKRN